MLIALLSQIRL